MNFKVVGGGPAGLYFAYLMKRRHPDYTVRVFEQNPPDATYGFGVVLTGRALSFLSESDAAVIQRLASRMESWSEQHIVHEGVRIAIDGNSISAIARLSMLKWLQEICREVGVEQTFNCRIEAAADHSDCDVLVAADGSNSVVRDRYPLAFDTRVMDLQNYYAWYGSAVPFPAHTINFKTRKEGLFCAHYYRYTATHGTFVPEIDPRTWLRSGLSEMSDDERKSFIEDVFAEELHRTQLTSNRSIWRRWRLITNGRWHYKNIALIGDAQRTAHPSIASGTRLAMEDSIALWRAFEEEGNDIAAAFKRYERERRPIRDKLNKAAEKSIAWYETVDTRMHLPHYEFVYSYVTRTGVITPDRLEKESPDFMRRYANERTRTV